MEKKIKQIIDKGSSKLILNLLILSGWHEFDWREESPVKEKRYCPETFNAWNAPVCQGLLEDWKLYIL